MRVMTYNLKVDHLLTWKHRWGKRSAGIFNLIDKLDVDIIGVQEVNKKMYEDISKNLSNYHIVGRKRKYGFFAESNNILISKKYSIIDDKTFWLSKTPWKKGTAPWHSLFPRICTTALVDIGGGKRVRIFNTHLDSLSQKAREFGLKIIGKYINWIYTVERTPVILMGDFNCKPENILISKINEGKYTRKKLISIGDYNEDIYKGYTYISGDSDKAASYLDYIFISEEFKYIKGSIIDNRDSSIPLSDHYPVMTEIDINR